MQLYVSTAALVITSGHGTILLGQASVKLSYMYFCIIINTRYRCCLIQTMCVHVCLHVCIHSTCVCTLYMYMRVCTYVSVTMCLCVCYYVFVCMCVTMCLCGCRSIHQEIGGGFRTMKVPTNLWIKNTRLCT